LKKQTHNFSPKIKQKYVFFLNHYNGLWSSCVKQEQAFALWLSEAREMYNYAGAGARAGVRHAGVQAMWYMQMH
jgi:hypothetical protein